MCATNAAREAALPYRVESVPFGARNAEHFSHEMASLPWSIFQFSGDTGDAPGWKRLVEFLNARLQHMEPVDCECSPLGLDGFMRSPSVPSP
jgi:hypothetical protein